MPYLSALTFISELLSELQTELQTQNILREEQCLLCFNKGYKIEEVLRMSKKSLKLRIIFSLQF